MCKFSTYQKSQSIGIKQVIDLAKLLPTGLAKKVKCDQLFYSSLWALIFFYILGVVKSSGGG